MLCVFQESSSESIWVGLHNVEEVICKNQEECDGKLLWEDDSVFMARFESNPQNVFISKVSKIRVSFQFLAVLASLVQLWE